MANQLDKIEHIVHLMLENRSFDQMLGFLYSDNGNQSPAGQPFDGLTGNESNPDDLGRPVGVYRIRATDPHPYLMPGADPGEGFQNTNYQLFSDDNPAPGAVPTNQGFVVNFKSAIATDQSRHEKDALPGTTPAQIMGMYTPELLPVLSGLAKGYAVCDRWFASAPTMTMPNRAFALAGTSQGHLDDHVKIFTCPSIFGRLSDRGVDWAIFGYNRDPLTRHDFPDTQNADDSHFGHFRDFQARAANGTLPAFTFIEPSWDANGNSQHPNYDVAAGEQLIHDVYYTLRNGPAWNSTLLVITYDEHGGNYDHVPPPSGATPPGDGTVGEFGFDFTRFGVRVPAVLVSPLIAAGTVFRSATGTIDHTSVLKTISERFGTAPLTARDQAAPSLGDVLMLATPRAAADDPLSGVIVPVSTLLHPNAARPSRLDKIHAARVAALPLRNEKGYYEEAEAPLASTAELSNFIRDRGAAWSQHRQRQQQRLQQRQPPQRKRRR
ncbi:alkaline phosphatase family protein [Burkholderia oklahomensis]|uniref:Phosphoesterase family protein n=1 Tax=Burkholderia oklahomensis TaxID=342113 RepID=A0AAI8B563_9BURK|nr:alkaline phosphatase family protein [Burkholderia oklahomensis]AIO65906.1 phosphoesterase family protein [Burkholderia oklahomensis]AOI44206.1 phosphoesterase [Burkholderia oklahomensis EO147]KUY57347.1 phosphoesterase [Burkholderia oklahomensis EO147]QPS37371.1 alkaline phosphatase family protein [Burkholderia oklahomensis]